MAKEEKVIINKKGVAIDLIALIELVFPKSLIYIAPDTHFEFSPSDRHKGNAATIADIIEQIGKAKIELSVEDLPKIAKALNILISSGELELVIARDRVCSRIAFLVLKKVEE